MQNQTFKAIVVAEENNSYTINIQQRSIDDLPGHDLLVQVCYSSLNYKDALSASGNKGVMRQLFDFGQG